MTEKQKWESYPKSKNKNFHVIDSIGVPHPYCITSKHLEYSEGMYLDVEGAERKGATCGICKGELSFEGHKQALLVNCKKELKDNKELETYLKSIVKKAEKDNYAGFAFKQDF